MSLNPHNQENCSRLLGTLGFPKPESSRQGQRSNSPVFSTMGQEMRNMLGDQFQSRGLPKQALYSQPDFIFSSLFQLDNVSFYKTE